MADGSCAAESHQKCHPETKQQWSKPNYPGAAQEDEGKRQNQSSIWHDEVVESPLRAQNVICPAGMRNRRLRNGIVNERYPKWKKYECDRNAYHSGDCGCTAYKCGH